MMISNKGRQRTAKLLILAMLFSMIMPGAILPVAADGGEGNGADPSNLKISIDHGLGEDDKAKSSLVLGKSKTVTMTMKNDDSNWFYNLGLRVELCPGLEIVESSSDALKPNSKTVEEIDFPVAGGGG